MLNEFVRRAQGVFSHVVRKPFRPHPNTIAKLRSASRLPANEARVIAKKIDRYRATGLEISNDTGALFQ